MTTTYREWANQECPDAALALLLAGADWTTHHPSLCGARCPCKTQPGNFTVPAPEGRHAGGQDDAEMAREDMWRGSE